MKSTLDIEQLIAKGEPRWARLGELLDQAERANVPLGLEGLEELLMLYRQSCTDLNLVRGLTANAMVLEPVNQVVGRAYRFIYSGGKKRALAPGAIRRLFFQEIPDAFQREARTILIAAVALIAGAVVGAAATVSDSSASASLIPAIFFTEHPGERVARIESGRERINSIERATAFGATLYTHNIQVTFLAFALGALTLFGGVWFAFINGLPLGALAARYYADDVGTFFIAWVGPHGALELPAVVFATAAGLRLGRALLLPGERGRQAALREALPTVWRILLADVILLIGAGIIEGSFSQLSARSVSYALKIAVAIALFSAMLYWLFFSTRSARRDQR